MEALIDTGVWFRRYHGLPMKPSLKKFLQSEITVFHLCTLSIAELTFKWQRGRLPGVPNPKEWLNHSLENFVIEEPSLNACLSAGLWNWPHGDFVDRTLAGVAADRGLTLIHTDSCLKDLTGFPQRYFPNAG
jgi:PIN domain nuclease of toxin-antitoxin system